MKLAKLAATLVCGCLWVLVLTGCGGGDDAPSVASIVVSPGPTTIGTSTTQQFTATARDQLGNTVSGVTFTWSSSASDVATVSGNGLASGVAAGTTNITASAQGVTSTAVALTVIQTTAVTGTAAVGAPLANATITLKDAQGTTRTATTGTNGIYSITTTGLIPPFLVQVQPATGSALYSVSADSSATGLINVTPLTDLIIRSWYGAQGVTMDTAFSASVSNPSPPPAEVDLISQLVVQIVKLWLDDAGVDSSTFNPISTEFAADGTGVDGVLDLTTIDTASGEITISDGTTTQVTDVSYDTDRGAINFSTTTTGANGASSSSGGTVVPVSDEEQSALEAINASLAGFAEVVNSNGTELTADDLAPFIGDTLLSEGLDKDQFAAVAATDLRGLSVVFEVNRILSLDLENGRADVEFKLTITAGEQSAVEIERFQFARSGSDWLIDGDQRIAAVSLHAEMRTNQGAFNGDSGPAINVDIQAPQATVTGVTISGGGIWTDTQLQQGATVAQDIEPTPGSTETLLLDHYFINSGPLAELIAAGTPFTFTLASGASVSYTLETNAFTTEPIAITSPTGSTLLHAGLGQPLEVSWTMPETYPIAEVDLMALVFTGDPSDPGTLQCEVDGPVLSTTSTSGIITIPTTCQGLPVLEANLNLSVTGVNGERNQVIHMFQ